MPGVGSIDGGQGVGPSAGKGSLPPRREWISTMTIALSDLAALVMDPKLRLLISAQFTRGINRFAFGAGYNTQASKRTT